MNRREFLTVLGAAAFCSPGGFASAPFPVRYRRQPPYAAALRFIEPGSDEFAGEKTATQLEAALEAAIRGGAPPLADRCEGESPAPTAYREIAPGVASAVFGAGPVAEGWRQWRDGLGEIRYARFYALPGDVIRYDIRSRNRGRLEQRCGEWKCRFEGGRLASLTPVEETLTHAAAPWFRDVTAHAFEGDRTFHEQLARGVPYWRARLDPACGIDVYGENGIAAADIDGDGVDEIFVCQPGGLPNRLYKNDGRGRFRDIAHEAGLDILDDTACALFVDLRNSGHQDLVLVRSNQPLLFLNDGNGRFTKHPDPFRFARRPQGSFTSVAAADFDGDGRLDLYFCCYVYYQSEAQYHYPVPYHDARNGPPNFLFRNRLDASPGYFEDVTAASGMDQNNDRFSFAASWCDFDGDGRPGLYVTNDFGRNNLYRNEGGRFRDVAEEAGVSDLGPGMSAAWLDYDGDGRPDLLVSNMWSAPGQRIVNDPAFGPAAKDPALRDAFRSHVKGNSLYRNEGGGKFAYTGDAQGIEMCPWSWSCDGFDFDNDGSPELYVACGMLTNDSPVDLMSYFYRQVVSKAPAKDQAAPEYENGWNAINQLIREDYSWAGREPDRFFARRAGRYYDFSGASGLDLAEDSRAFAFTDIDGDGNMDLVLKSRLGPQVRVFQNACAGARRAVVLGLRGTKSNRDAIGARVEFDGQTKWLFAGSGYLSQHTKRLHFGVRGEAPSRARIHWPSGEVQETPPLAAGFLYEITEGTSEIASKRLAEPSALPEGGAIASDNRARLHTAWLWEPVPLPESRSGPALLAVHAGEAIPRSAAAQQSIDLRSAAPEIAAAYAIFRRYLFDHRADLVTPLWLLIDAQGRARKVYESAPSAAEAGADLSSLSGPLPDPRGLPFAGFFTGSPRRDYYKFGGALLQAGYPEQALPYLEEALRRAPDTPKLLFAVGRVHLLANRLPQAREALERVLRIDPRMPEAWNELGGVEAAAGNFGQALQDYEKALAIAPGFSYALLNAGGVAEKLGRNDEAERRYRQLLTADPSNADAANALGRMLAKQGRTDEARNLFELAISIHRDDATAINNLGVLYGNLGQTNDAIAAFQYGLRVAPDDEQLALNLARIWVQTGHREKARDLMQQWLERHPESRVAQKALQELEIR